jgi:hypothetical protein
MENTLKLPSPTKLAWMGHFPPASQAGRRASPVFYVHVFSLGMTLACEALSRLNSGSGTPASDPLNFFLLYFILSFLGQ